MQAWGAAPISSDAMPIRVVVAEDTFLVREAVTRLLADAADIEPVAAVGDRATLMATVEAVRAVHAGGSSIDPKIVELLVESRSQADDSPLAALTPRELETLAEIAQGKSNEAIAESLVLTKRAVEKHINAIFMKLGLARSRDVSSRVKAALLFLAENEGLPVGPGASERD